MGEELRDFVQKSLHPIQRVLYIAFLSVRDGQATRKTQIPSIVIPTRSSRQSFLIRDEGQAILCCPQKKERDGNTR